MCTKEANIDKLDFEDLNSINANLVESFAINKDRSKHFKRQNGKNSQKKGQLKATGGKIEKKKLVCYVCGKEGHESYQCNQRKGRSNQRPIPQAILAEQDDGVITTIIEDTMNGERVFMGNSVTAKVLGKGRNLISGSLLNQVGLKIVLESDKVILTKNGDFVDKGYLSNSVFILNIVSMNASASRSCKFCKYLRV
ncbi:ty1-copia retrotransposon protein [Cucumis melo var. makuwa]|uniref:Ty1-copia retrotransposon protein n=1 Tax=Cucumis melo var. makuwa TaxID=1194695 RepID=A0A5D3BM19_CUCMM|nr:ty1-copia retrotransposon protein [Cucumis melo var. makuwa]